MQATLKPRITRRLLAAWLLAALPTLPAFAGQEEAEDAMTALLFDSEDIHAEEVVYTLDDGVPEALADRFIERLRSHPDIAGANIHSADICVDIKR